jgi:hypothetical protein
MSSASHEAHRLSSGSSPKRGNAGTLRDKGVTHAPAFRVRSTRLERVDAATARDADRLSQKVSHEVRDMKRSPIIAGAVCSIIVVACATASRKPTPTPSPPAPAPAPAPAAPAASVCSGGCYFNGRLFADGSSMCMQGFQQRCVGTTWITTGPPEVACGCSLVQPGGAGSGCSGCTLNGQHYTEGSFLCIGRFQRKCAANTWMIPGPPFYGCTAGCQ